MNKIINGDSLKVLKKLEDDSVDLVCTDPPYGYSFMGKDWDKVVPSVEIWKECLRVLKPGGFCFVMSAPRIDVQSRMATKLEDAGFQTNFSPIYWTYATGFPKATNVGKAVDKKLGKTRRVVGKRKDILEKQAKDLERGYRKIKDSYDKGAPQRNNGFKTVSADITEPASDEAKTLEGSYVGYQPKPAVEVVLVAMKPITEKSYIEQAMKNGKGVTWLDDCRIPYQSEKDLKSATFGTQTDIKNNNFNNNRPSDGHVFAKDVEGNPDGRFAANLIVQDDVLNDGKNRKTTWISDKHQNNRNGDFLGSMKHPGNQGYNDEGSFSRFYDLDSWWKSQIHKLPEGVQKTFPFMIVAKASKREKNEGLVEFEDKLPDTNDFKNLPMTKNNHPTVKPIELMSYLITLGSREGDVVVDPFVGSGTTCIAAKLLNRQYIGIEKEEDYAIIAKARIKNVESKENNKASQFFEL